MSWRLNLTAIFDYYLFDFYDFLNHNLTLIFDCYLFDFYDFFYA